MVTQRSFFAVVQFQLAKMREVITLQLGDAANWVGAHFWNLQARVSRKPRARPFSR